MQICNNNFILKKNFNEIYCNSEWNLQQKIIYTYINDMNKDKNNKISLLE